MRKTTLLREKAVPVDSELVCGESTGTQDGDTCKLLDDGDMGDDNLEPHSPHLLRPPCPPRLLSHHIHCLSFDPRKGVQPSKVQDRWCLKR